MSRFLALSLVFLFAPLSIAQEDKIRWVKLSVEPRAAPVPALKYHLLPEVRDLKPGNAALLYQRAHSLEWGDFLKGDLELENELSQEWTFDKTPKNFPKEKVRKILPPGVLKELDLGARRSYCNWQMTERIKQEGFLLPLPEMQKFRQCAQVLNLRAQLEIAEGNYDKAIYTLQTALAMARHVGDQPTLISGLVGLAIERIFLANIEALIQQPNAPNMYWALSDLPQPLINMRKGIQDELLAVESMFQEIQQALDNPQRPPLNPEQIRKSINKFAYFGAVGTANNEVFKNFMAYYSAPLVQKEARQYLINHGFAANQLDALPKAQIVLMYNLAEYREIIDELRIWNTSPAWVWLPITEKLEQRTKIKANSTSIVTLGKFIVPSMNKIARAQVPRDRRVAALRVIEAIRLYAAAHQGKLPLTLPDIREVPVPNDPLTGHPFTYYVAEGKAWLSGPPLPGEVARDGNLIQYEITLRGSKK